MLKKLILPVIALAMAVMACGINLTDTPVAPTSVPPVVIPTIAEVIPTVEVIIPTTVPAPTQPTGQIGGGGILFADDFSSSNTGWEVGTYTDGSVGYGSSYYFVKSTVNGTNMYGMGPVQLDNTADATIQVDAAMISGPTNYNVGYGIICRLVTTGNSSGDGYYFRISADGMYSVLLATDSGFTSLLTGDKWQNTSAVNTGYAVNHIQATCNGNQLTFVVNGTTLWQGTDSTFTSGGVGLMAITYEDNNPVEVHYNGFGVSKP